ncbi:MAG TPA: hypothetical protein VL947_04730, partial [Cytophagales bacterium]|nr:hypothetical protein [Cytophagales bacterium]
MRKHLCSIFIILVCFVSFSQEKKVPLLKRLFGKRKSQVPVWVAKKGPYQAEATKYHDLIHTKLHVSFNWDKKQMLGKARLTLKPHFFTQDSLILDAKGFDIQSITFFKGKESYSPAYTYDKKELHI